MNAPAIAHDAQACLARFLRDVPKAADRLSALSLQLIEEPGRIADRSNMRGHLTASALVLSPDLSEVLMIDHLTLLRLLQPGGHADGGDSLEDEARRENVEETGVADIDPVGPSPIDVDTHPIPANPRKGEGDHFHHDFMFAFVARSREIPKPQLDEVSRALWVPIDQARLDARMDRALARIV